MRKKKKRTNKDALMSWCENLWKRCCRARDKKCIFCGSTYVLQVHHLFSRQNAATFLDVRNGATLCRACHAKVTFNTDFKTEFTIFLVALFGADFLTELRLESKKECKWTIQKLEEKKAELEKYLEEVTNG